MGAQVQVTVQEVKEEGICSRRVKEAGICRTPTVKNREQLTNITHARVQLSFSAHAVQNPLPRE